LAPWSWRRILVAIEFSPLSGRLLDYATRLMAREPTDVILLHVLEPICVTRDFGYGPVTWTRANSSAMAQAKAKLRRLAARRLGSGRAWSVCVRSGVTCDEIVKAAREMDIGLIIIGTEHVAPSLPGEASSVASRVGSRAHCPVLVLRNPVIN
jgi:nucleotide-binding universal stress UspA family protein